MKKTKSAVKYGMEVLKLTPDELFKLIESSQNYDGSDYSRWLADKIIKVAEKEGILFSQLLVKKFNIINEIVEEVTSTDDIRSEFLEIFGNILGEGVYSVNFPSMGVSLDDVDWFNGIDLDSENSFFTKEKLPLEVKNKIVEDETLSLVIRLGIDSPDKKSDLFLDAKRNGIGITSKGALMLYRMCSLASTYPLSKFKLGVYAPVKFFYDEANLGIINYMLSYYKVALGFSMKSIELSINSINAGDMAFISLIPRDGGIEEDDGITLNSIILDSNSCRGYQELGIKRYSRSRNTMLDKIIRESEAYISEPELGYLNINGTMSISSKPEEGKKNIKIVEKNLKDIIAYYGVSVSREISWGYSTDLACFIDGRVGYEELLYNCLPLFLFDYKVFLGGSLSLDSEIIANLLDIGTPYFSFEAKELYNLCKDYYEENESRGYSFKELLSMDGHEDFLRLYESKLSSLKEFINTLSKKFI